jgi:hypothetical protein
MFYWKRERPPSAWLVAIPGCMPERPPEPVLRTRRLACGVVGEILAILALADRAAHGGTQSLVLLATIFLVVAVALAPASMFIRWIFDPPLIYIHAVGLIRTWTMRRSRLSAALRIGAGGRDG